MPSKEEQRHNVPNSPMTPTKRRGPIAAEFVTPGPAYILLPSTFGPNARDTRKANAPAYSFGVRYEEKKDNSTPGPGEYSVEGVTNTGKDWSPVAFFSPKFKEPERFSTPPPGSYNPEKCIKAIKGEAPSFSFGAKVEGPKLFETPSPCHYNTERALNHLSTHPHSPSFTLSMRVPRENTDNQIPGPGTYNVPRLEAYKIKTPPAFTLSGRTSLPEDKTLTPAPSAYNTEKVWINRSNSPQYSFGVRHSQYAYTC